MKKLFLLIACAALLSCDSDANTRNVGGDYSMPEGLSDCQIYRMESGGIVTTLLYVVRCPFSQTSTTFPVGKSQLTVSVVEKDTTGMGEYLRLKEKFGEK